MSQEEEQLKKQVDGLVDEVADRQQYPEGKFGPDDEGELMIAMGCARGRGVIDFRKPVAWIALKADQARAIAAGLNQKADQLDEERRTLS